jgi:hypothetical protein
VLVFTSSGRSDGELSVNGLYLTVFYRFLLKDDGILYYYKNAKASTDENTIGIVYFINYLLCIIVEVVVLVVIMVVMVVIVVLVIVEVVVMIIIMAAVGFPVGVITVEHGRIELASHSVTKVSIGDMKFAFRVMHGASRQFNLAADTDEDRSRWIAAIETAVAAMQRIGVCVCVCVCVHTCVCVYACACVCLIGRALL